MATVTQAGVVKKLDKMLVLLAKPETWIKGTYKRKAEDPSGNLIIDKKTRRPVMAYCLMGAAHQAGNGVQLYWELAWTIDSDALMERWNNAWSFSTTKDIASDHIINYNDKTETEYQMIKSVIVRTRARIKRYGLLKIATKKKAA